jgi:Uma2 family endonuclease
MAKLLLPRSDLKRMIRDRQKYGADHHDEVWDGVYFMPPIADIEHHGLTGLLTAAIINSLGPGHPARVFPGINVSDRADDWTKNYRVPDIAVVLPGNPAEDRETHLLGGPDFAIEILSPGDRARKKFDFYAKVGVRELMLVSRKPWRIELYAAREGVLAPAGISDPATSALLTSTVLSLTFRLLPGQPRPQIEVTRTADGQHWLA